MLGLTSTETAVYWGWVQERVRSGTYKYLVLMQKQARRPQPEQQILRWWGVSQRKATSVLCHLLFQPLQQTQTQRKCPENQLLRGTEAKDCTTHQVRAQLHLPVHTAPGLPGAVSDEESIVKFLPSSEIMCKLPPLKLEHDHKMQFGHDLVPLQSLDLSD